MVCLSLIRTSGRHGEGGFPWKTGAASSPIASKATPSWEDKPAGLTAGDEASMLKEHTMLLLLWKTLRNMEIFLRNVVKRYILEILF